MNLKISRFFNTVSVPKNRNFFWTRKRPNLALFGSMFDKPEKSGTFSKSQKCGVFWPRDRSLSIFGKFNDSEKMGHPLKNCRFLYFLTSL